MAVPVCPDCGTTIEPDWDWCHSCGFDPEGVRPADWTPSTGALSVFPPAKPAPDRPSASPDVRPTGAAPASPHPLDLLRPPEAGVPSPAAAPVNGPLVAPEPEAEHRPLTLDDLRRSTTNGGPGGAAPADGAARSAPVSPPDARPAPPAPLADLPARDRPTDDRPPLFPASTTARSDLASDRRDPAELVDAPVAGASIMDSLVDDLPVQDEAHPYFDLPYDEPSPAPGSEPEPEPPPSRLRRRKAAQDDRPNAASMAMAAGRLPAEGAVMDAPAPSPVAAPSGAPLPPPPSSAARPAASADPAEGAVETPTSPADSSSLGPIVFGAPGSPLDALPKKPQKAKSSPLSVVAILMTLAIAVIVLWPTYKSLSESESGPALPPSSAGPIGYAPAQADGSRAPIDPQRTAFWGTSAPVGGGFEIDMPGVVVTRTVDVPLDNGAAKAVVASSSTGRGGYVVAAVDAPAGAPWASLPAAANAFIGGFDDVVGNQLTVGPSTTVGGLPALTVEGTIDGVPSKGAMLVAGNKLFVAVAGNASSSDLDRFLSSFQPTS